jgi:PIN domain nuclease of toxin-antitoxin system
LIVLDTHALVFMRVRPDLLGKDAERAIAGATVIGVSDIVLWEIAMLVEKRELRLSEPTRQWLETALMEPRIELVPISAAIAARTPAIAQAVRQDPSDHIIAATAMELGWPLVTKDAALQRLGGLETIW